MDENKFTIIIKRASDYKIYPAGVIWGGPAPDLESILMNICLDHSAFPSYIQHPISEGRVDMSRIQDQAVMGHVDREVLCGISLTIEQAKRMVVWLNQNIQTIEEKRRGE